MTVHLLLAEDC